MRQYAINVADAQHALGLGRTTLYGLLATGRLQRIKIGRRTLITIASVERLLQDALNEGSI